MRNESSILAKPVIFNTSLVHGTLLSVAQQMLTDLGWEDLRPAIYAAEQADYAMAMELKTAHAAFMEEPETPQLWRLQAALDKTIQKLQIEYQKIIKLKTQAEQRLSQLRKASPTSSQISRLRGWAFSSLQQIFDSDEVSVVRRYSEIAQNKQASIKALKHYRDALAVRELDPESESKTENNSLQILLDTKPIPDAKNTETTSDSPVENHALFSVPSHARQLLSIDAEELNFDEFRVEAVAGTQRNQNPQIATFSNGGYMITWEAERYSDYNVYAQRYETHGSSGPQFQVNNYTKNWQCNSTVGAFSNNYFVIVWQSDGQDGDSWGIYAQRYRPGNIRLGSEFPVNTYTKGPQINPSIGTFNNGGFVIAWQSDKQDGDTWGVYAQLYSVRGTKLGGEFQVNTHTKNCQHNPSVGTFSDGSFVIAWSSYGQDGDWGWGIYAQRYSDNGTRLGKEFQVSTYKKSEYGLSIGIFNNDNFVITWSGSEIYENRGHEWNIYAQCYSADGARLDNAFQVNTYKNYTQTRPSVGTFNNGSFVIAWGSYGQGGDGWGIYAQRYSACRTPMDTEFPVSKRRTQDLQGKLSIGTFKDDSFVIAWTGVERRRQEGFWGYFGYLENIYGIYAAFFFNPVTPFPTPAPTPSPSPTQQQPGPRLSVTTIIVGLVGGLGLIALLGPPGLRMLRRRAFGISVSIAPVEHKTSSSVNSNDVKINSSLITAKTQPQKNLVTVHQPIPSSSYPLEEKKKEYVVPISIDIDFTKIKIDYDSELGTGGYGTVYQGTYKYENVAIKKLNTKNLDKEALKELKQEAKIMVSINSRYVIQLRGVCLKPPHFCLVMELMPKGSLHGVLKNNPNLPLLTIYQIALDVGYGLCVLHEKNIIHRDLKSLNVLLNDRFRAKICDFGLAKVKTESGNTTETKGTKGTLGWMAPELFENEPPPTHTSIDIYAFGMILWELAIKPYRRPFHDLALNAVIAAKVQRGPKQEAIPNGCDFAHLMRDC
ncbi:MAG: protein kinase, partial [Proteobacteria bacterium]|nr:protein kinase [Pseudomonadota bacterium]